MSPWQMKRGHSGELPLPNVLGSKIGRFQEADQDEKEAILKHVSDEIKSWRHIVDAIEKSGSHHGFSNVQKMYRNDAKAHQSILEKIAHEMREHLKHLRRHWDPLKSLQQDLESKGYEAKVQRCISAASL